MANLPPVLKQYWTDSDGNPLAGGKIYTYQAGTTTPQATYTDSTGNTESANPIVLDASGFAPMWLDPDLSYKFVVKDSDDVTQHTIDNVVGLLTADAVATASIQDDAVTEPKIADDAVTADKLADSADTDGDRAVTTDHIRDACVTRVKLAVGAVAKRSVSSQTTTFTASSDVDVYLISTAAGAFTGTLPSAVGLEGKVFKFIKTESSANIFTLDGDGSETIGGTANRKLGTVGAQLEIISDGTNWQVLQNEPVIARYSSDAGGTWQTSATTVNYEDKEADTHDAVTVGASWIFTAPRPGKYAFSARAGGTASLGAGNSVATEAHHVDSGSVETLIDSDVWEASATNTTLVLNQRVSGVISLAASEGLRFKTRTSGSTGTLASSPDYMNVSIWSVD